MKKYFFYISLLLTISLNAHNPEHLKKVLAQIANKQKVCATGFDLSGLNFGKFTIMDKKLPINAFDEATFFGADISNCDFSHFNTYKIIIDINTILDGTKFSFRYNDKHLKLVFNTDAENTRRG